MSLGGGQTRNLAIAVGGLLARATDCRRRAGSGGILAGALPAFFRSST